MKKTKMGRPIEGLKSKYVLGSIRLPKTLWNDLKRMASKEERSLNDVIVDSLKLTASK